MRNPSSQSVRKPLLSSREPATRVACCLALFSLLRSQRLCFAVAGLLGAGTVITVAELALPEESIQWHESQPSWVFHLTVVLGFGGVCFLMSALAAACVAKRCQREPVLSLPRAFSAPGIPKLTEDNYSFSAQQLQRDRKLKATCVQQDCLAVLHCMEVDPARAKRYFHSVKQAVKVAQGRGALVENIPPVMVVGRAEMQTAHQILSSTEQRFPPEEESGEAMRSLSETDILTNPGLTRITEAFREWDEPGYHVCQESRV